METAGLIAAGLRDIGVQTYVVRGEEVELLDPADRDRALPPVAELIARGRSAWEAQEAAMAARAAAFDEVLQLAAQLPAASDQLKQVAARAGDKGNASTR